MLGECSIYFVLVTVPLGLALESSRTALRKECAGREKKMHKMSNAIFSLMISLFPPLLYLTTESKKAQDALIQSNLIYRTHTPYCTRNESVATWGNIPYVGCFLMQDYADGVAEIPVWKNATSFLNRTEARALADSIADGIRGSFALPDGMEFDALSYRDFRRLYAVMVFEREYVEVFFINLLQAEILTQTVFAGIIFALIVKVNVKTVTSFAILDVPWLFVAGLAAILEFFLAFFFVKLAHYGPTLFQYNFVILAMYNVALWRLSVIHVSGPFRLVPWLCSVLGLRLKVPASADETGADTTSVPTQPSPPSLDEEDSDGEIEISTVWIQ